MPFKNKELQRRFREKMYKAGLKQGLVWIKRKESKQASVMSQGDFNKKFKKITSEWTEIEIDRLLNLFIKIAEGEKEVRKLREKA